MDIKTTDICDCNPKIVQIAESIGFKDYGGIKNFFGKIQTVKCFEDNSFARKALEEDGKGRVLVVNGGGSLRFNG